MGLLKKLVAPMQGRPLFALGVLFAVFTSVACTYNPVGDAYVDAAAKNTNDFNRPFQELINDASDFRNDSEKLAQAFEEGFEAALPGPLREGARRKGIRGALDMVFSGF